MSGACPNAVWCGGWFIDHVTVELAYLCLFPEALEGLCWLLVFVFPTTSACCAMRFAKPFCRRSCMHCLLCICLFRRVLQEVEKGSEDGARRVGVNVGDNMEKE